MNVVLKPGQGLFFMKIGVHAQESLEEIIKRKLKEIEAAGFCMWGYGGGTCHPLSTVQPFVKEKLQAGQPVYMVMNKMESKHFAEPVEAKEYSVDGKTWLSIPKGVSVRGSRYAVVLDRLEEAEFELPLDMTHVAYGPSKGRVGSRYVRGRVDKACLDVDKVPIDPTEKASVKIGMIARVAEPYAVIVK